MKAFNFHYLLIILFEITKILYCESSLEALAISAIIRDHFEEKYSYVNIVSCDNGSDFLVDQILRSQNSVATQVLTGPEN